MHAAVLVGDEINAEMRAELAGVLDDGVADRLALGVVGLERRVDVVVVAQMPGQRLRVASGLGHAEAHMRARIGRGIADHGDAAEHDRGRGEIVDRRDERLLDLGHAVEQRRRHDGAGVGEHLRDQVLADQRRRHRELVLHAVLVDAHIAKLAGIGDAIPDDVVTPLAGREIVIEAGDRIAEHLLALGQIERVERVDGAPGLGREISLVRRAAPDVIAGIDRADLGRQLRAHARAHAVAADQNVAMLDLAAGKICAGKFDPHAALVLIDPLEIMAEMIMRIVDGGAQQPLHPVPGGHDLRQRAFVGDAPGAVDGDALSHFDAEIFGAGAARFQSREQFRMAGDAGAAADQLDAGALIDVDIPADLAQERGREQTRHRAADDDGTPPHAVLADRFRLRNASTRDGLPHQAELRWIAALAGIRDFRTVQAGDVDGRDKPGHDGLGILPILAAPSLDRW